MRRIHRHFLSAVLALSLAQTAAFAAGEPYRDPQRPVEERVRDLLGRMALEEKVAQLTQKRTRDLKMDGPNAAPASLAGSSPASVTCAAESEVAAR